MGILCLGFVNLVAVPILGSSFSLYVAVMSYCSNMTLNHSFMTSLNILFILEWPKILILSNPLVQVELERLRLLCERIVKREKLKVAFVFFFTLFADYMYDINSSTV